MAHGERAAHKRNRYYNGRRPGNCIYQDWGRYSAKANVHRRERMQARMELRTELLERERAAQEAKQWARLTYWDAVPFDELLAMEEYIRLEALSVAAIERDHEREMWNELDELDALDRLAEETACAWGHE
jgi:hypothetical protein